MPSRPTSPRHQREHAPAQVFTGVRGVAFGSRGQFGSNIFREVVVGIRFEPSAHGEPLGRLVPVPAVLVCQNHFHDVVVEVAERREKFWKQEKVGDRTGKASLGTQDNGSHCGPSRTLNRWGIRTSDWHFIAGGDGFQVRVDPEDPSIVYAQMYDGN